MSDYCDEDLLRKQATDIVVNRYHHDTPGSRDGITRQAGVVATGNRNERDSTLATFRGKEQLRRANTR